VREKSGRNGRQRPAALRWCGHSEPSDEFCTKDKTEILKVQHLFVTPHYCKTARCTLWLVTGHQKMAGQHNPAAMVN